MCSTEAGPCSSSRRSAAVEGGMAGTSEEVRGREVVIRFDGSRCIHSRNCVLGRPDVFVPNVEGEWIHPDSATPDEVAHLALTCPSGAITYERLDGGRPEAPPKVNTLHIRENGPLTLHAPAHRGGRSAGPARHVVPLRRIAQQALVRREPYVDRLPGHRGTRDQGVAAARYPRRTGNHHADR
jgi:uncharacterized Fe-S cluster protein YjdI